jgi:uncharacterized protein YggE
MKSGITVSATGTASAPPDRATITIGTSAVRPVVSEATQLVDGRVRELMHALAQNGVERSNVQTSDLSVWPETDRNGVVSGYRARNLVSIRINDVDKVGEIIAAALSALGESAEMHGLRFEREDASGPETEARARAWKEIISKASELARLAGLTLGRPVSIVESSGPSPIVPSQMRMAATAAATPVEPGSSSIQINLVVRFALTE